MSEIYRPGDFSPYAGSEANSHSPHVVVRQTGENLRLFLDNPSLNRHVLTDYLTEFTIPYIQTTKDAIPMVKALANDMGVDSYSDVRNFINSQGPPAEAEASVEAFDYAAVVFSQLPKKYRTRLFPYGLKRDGIYGAPSTISGYVRRIDELERVTNEIISGKVKRISNSSFRTPLVRTEAFFITGAALPPPSVGEKGKIDLEIDSLNTMLEGIDIDFTK